MLPLCHDPCSEQRQRELCVFLPWICSIKFSKEHYSMSCWFVTAEFSRDKDPVDLSHKRKSPGQCGVRNGFFFFLLSLSCYACYGYLTTFVLLSYCLWFLPQTLTWRCRPVGVSVEEEANTGLLYPTILQPPAFCIFAFFLMAFFALFLLQYIASWKN